MGDTTKNIATGTLV